MRKYLFFALALCVVEFSIEAAYVILAKRVDAKLLAIDLSQASKLQHLKRRFCPACGAPVTAWWQLNDNGEWVANFKCANGHRFRMASREK